MNTAAPHQWLSLMGGSIGQGLPLATGAAVACPDLDWVKLAEGMGFAASKSTNGKEFREQFESAMKNRGPCLIEVEL